VGQFECERRIAIATRTTKEAAAAPHNAQTHQANRGTPGTTGQIGPFPRELRGQSFASSAIQSPSPTPSTIAASQTAFPRLIRATVALGSQQGNHLLDLRDVIGHASRRRMGARVRVRYALVGPSEVVVHEVEAHGCG